MVRHDDKDIAWDLRIVPVDFTISVIYNVDNVFCFLTTFVSIDWKTVLYLYQ